MTAIPLDKVEAFLGSALPFSALPEEARARLAPSLLMEYFPKGEIFIRAGDKPLQFLYLVSKGALKLFTRNGREEVTLDLRSEYDGVGLAALAAGQPTDFNVKAEEDTICYLVPRDAVLELAEAYPRFKALAFDLLKALQPAPEDPDQGARPPGVSSGEEAMFLTPVSSLLQRPAVSSGPDVSIRSAASPYAEGESRFPGDCGPGRLSPGPDHRPGLDSRCGPRRGSGRPGRGHHADPGGIHTDPGFLL